MKKFIITAIIAAINLCAFAQIDPALLSMKNRQITNSTQVVTPNTAQSTPTPTQQAQTASVKKRVPTQHMVTSSIQTDTNGNAKKQSIIDRLNGLENPIKEEWDAVFVREHKEKALALKDGFHIEATMVKRVKNQGLTSPLLTINTNEYQNTGLKEAPAPAPVFDDKPITVQFSQDGKLIPLSSLTTQQKKAIVDTMQVQKPLTVQAIFNNLDNDDDLIDSIFNQTPHIIFRGETFEKVLN